MGGQVYADGLAWMTRQPLRFATSLRDQTRHTPLSENGSLWASATALSERYEARPGILQSSDSSRSVSIGFSKYVTDQIAFNIGVGMTQGRIHTGTSMLRLDTLQLDADAEYRFGQNRNQQPFVGATISIGAIDVQGKRRLPGFSATDETGEGNMYAARLHAGHRMRAGQWRIVPSASLDMIRASIDGSPYLPNDHQLTLRSHGSRRSTSARLGLDLGYQFAVKKWTVKPELGANYRRTFGGTTTQVHNHVAGHTLTQRSAARARNTVTGTVRLQASRASWYVALEVASEKANRANTTLFSVNSNYAF